MAIDEKDRHTLYQLALFQSVALGEYYGASTVGEFKSHGDFGMGIFEGVNGELVMLDGVVYQALHDGSVICPPDDTPIPYGNAAFFEADIDCGNITAGSMDELAEILDRYVNENGRNQFYFAKVAGHFSHVTVRSELKQEEPYRMLNIALRTDQRKYEYEDIDGTIIGLYCPDYMQSMNAPGWHFHFVSYDGTKAGHMTEAAPSVCRAELNRMSRFTVDIPDTDSFNRRDLGKDLMSAIREAESGTFKE
ncbi:MAG: acetolactate decarboxylase [Parasporobacterium sp.]|nr:acetolactate decarboxylase [Parasporobacterium sp.]